MKYIIGLLLFMAGSISMATTLPQSHAVTTDGDSCTCKLSYGRCNYAWGANTISVSDYVKQLCAENKSAKITSKTYIYDNEGSVTSVIINYEIIDPKQQICRGFLSHNCVQP